MSRPRLYLTLYLLLPPLLGLFTWVGIKVGYADGRTVGPEVGVVDGSKLGWADGGDEGRPVGGCRCKGTSFSTFPEASGALPSPLDFTDLARASAGPTAGCSTGEAAWALPAIKRSDFASPPRPLQQALPSGGCSSCHDLEIARQPSLPEAFHLSRRRYICSYRPPWLGLFTWVGINVGYTDGNTVGLEVGVADGSKLGWADGRNVGTPVGGWRRKRGLALVPYPRPQGHSLRRLTLLTWVGLRLGRALGVVLGRLLGLCKPQKGATSLISASPARPLQQAFPRRLFVSSRPRDHCGLSRR